MAGPVTPYEAVKGMSATDLKLAVEQPRVDFNGTHEGRAPLMHMAITNSNKMSTEMLLNHSAGVGVRGRGESTPLHQTVRGGHAWAIDMLLDNGADLAATSLGMTGLHIAAKAGDEKMARLLLNRNSDIEAISTDTEEFTALRFPAQSSHVNMLAMPPERRAAISAIGHDWDTPLNVATWEGHEKAVQLLLDQGAEMKIAEEWLHISPFCGLPWASQSVGDSVATRRRYDDPGFVGTHSPPCGCPQRPHRDCRGAVGGKRRPHADNSQWPHRTACGCAEWTGCSGRGVVEERSRCRSGGHSGK